MYVRVVPRLTLIYLIITSLAEICIPAPLSIEDVIAIPSPGADCPRILILGSEIINYGVNDQSSVTLSAEIILDGNVL